MDESTGSYSTLPSKMPRPKEGQGCASQAASGVESGDVFYFAAPYEYCRVAIPLLDFSACHELVVELS